MGIRLSHPLFHVPFPCSSICPRDTLGTNLSHLMFQCPVPQLAKGHTTSLPSHPLPSSIKAPLFSPTKPAQCSQLHLPWLILPACYQFSSSMFKGHVPLPPLSVPIPQEGAGEVNHSKAWLKPPPQCIWPWLCAFLLILFPFVLPGVLLQWTPHYVCAIPRLCLSHISS